jgi:MFS family permease
VNPQVVQVPRAGAAPDTPPRPENLRYAWYVVTVLMLVYTLSFVDRQILSLMVKPIQADLHVTDTQVGLLQGLAFALFYTFLGLPLGVIADTMNRRNLVVGGVTLWSFFTAGCAAAKSFGSLFLARIGVGVGEATLGPCAYSMIADYFPKERLGLAMSIYYMGNLLGSGLAQIVGGTTVDKVMRTKEVTLPILGTIASWRTTFIIVGAPGLLFALWLMTIREPARRHLKALTVPERFNFSVSIGAIRERWQTVVGISVGMVFQAACNYGFMAWAPTFFQRMHGWSAGQAGRALGVTVITWGLAGMYFGGWYSDRWYRRGVCEAPLRMALPSALGCGLFIGLAMIMKNPYWTIALSGPGVFFMAVPMGVVPGALQMIFPNQLRGQVTALFLFVLNLGAQTVGPLLPAVLNDYVFKDKMMVGYSIAITTAVSGLLMFAILWATIKPYQRDHKIAHPDFLVT